MPMFNKRKKKNHGSMLGLGLAALAAAGLYMSRRRKAARENNDCN